MRAGLVVGGYEFQIQNLELLKSHVPCFQPTKPPNKKSHFSFQTPTSTSRKKTQPKKPPTISEVFSPPNFSIRPFFADLQALGPVSSPPKVVGGW